jgi:hypothetical protein
MANNPLFSDATTNAAVNAATALANAGFLVIYTGSQPSLDGALTGTLLVTLNLSATAFGSSSAAAGTCTATANTITNGTAGNTGAAGYHAILASNGTTVVWTGSVGTSGADLNLSSLAVVSGAIVSCSAYTYSQPQN